MEIDKTTPTDTGATTSTEPAAVDSSTVTTTDREPKSDLRSALQSKLRETPVERGLSKEKPSIAIAPREGTQAAPSQPQQQAQFEPIAAPADMSKEEREFFSKLSPEMQQYLSRRSYQYQSDHTRKVNALSAREREISDIIGVTQPIRDEYARRNISMPQLIQNAIAWDRAFQQDRISAAKEYLESWGIDVHELAALQGQQQPGQEGYGQQQRYLTPEDAALLAEQKVQEAFERQQQEQLAHHNFTVVQSFLGSKPLFRDPGTAAQLEAEMAPLVAARKAQEPNADPNAILAWAYDVVTKTNPTFSELTSKLAAKSEAERKSAEAQKALAASRSISGGPGSGTPKIKTNSLRENLELRLNGSR